MTTVVYPPEFAQKVLALEAAGGEPARLSLVAPTVVSPGEPFALRLAAWDADGLAAMDVADAAVVSCGAAEPDRVEIALPSAGPAIAAVEGVTLAEAGLYRFAVRLGGLEAFSNAVCVRRRPGVRLWWGDPHIHTVLSNCHPERCRSLSFGYYAARYFEGLDWAAMADHVSNGRCELARWKEQMLACEAHDDPPRFVTMPAYEASLKGGAGGDNNVYTRRPLSMFIDEYEQGDVGTLAAKLAERLPREDFVIVPHHTTRTGKHGEIAEAIYPGPDVMPVIEIHSKWGTSEYRGNPGPLRKVHPGPSYAVDLLNRGLPLGFIGGTDTHATITHDVADHLDHLPGPPGLTAALCPHLRRGEIFDAIRHRRCYAAKGERVYLDVRVAGADGGRCRPRPQRGEPVTVEATAAAAGELEAIELVRNGETIDRHEPDGWSGRAEFVDGADLAALAVPSAHLGRVVYYYVRVTARNGSQAWSSPVWLQVDS